MPLPIAAPPKKSKSKWHFGIRSRSPPMEIMLELYRTLQVLGMEWRLRPELENALQPKAAGSDDNHRESNAYDDAVRGQELFFLETRWRVGNVLVRMDLQLYRVDVNNYLVDFRNVGYALQEPEEAAPGSEGEEAQHGPEGSADGKAEVDATLEKAAKEVEAQLKAQKIKSEANVYPKASLAPAVPTGRKEVCSPFLFLECATRLM